MCSAISLYIEKCQPLLTWFAFFFLRANGADSGVDYSMVCATLL